MKDHVGRDYDGSLHQVALSVLSRIIERQGSSLRGFLRVVKQRFLKSESRIDIIPSIQS